MNKARQLEINLVQENFLLSTATEDFHDGVISHTTSSILQFSV